MATRDKVQTDPLIDFRLHAWTGLLNGDDGDPASSVRSGDRTAQVYGTFGVGGTVVIEGSLDKSHWFQLRDPTGTLISFTAAGGKAILESTPYVRPRVSAGDGATSLTALISVRKGH